MIIEKNQGCDHMVCVCGHSFDWPTAVRDHKKVLDQAMEEKKANAAMRIQAIVRGIAGRAAAVEKKEAIAQAAQTSLIQKTTADLEAKVAELELELRELKNR